MRLALWIRVKTTQFPQISNRFARNGTSVGLAAYRIFRQITVRCAHSGQQSHHLFQIERRARPLEFGTDTLATAKHVETYFQHREGSLLEMLTVFVTLLRFRRFHLHPMTATSSPEGTRTYNRLVNRLLQIWLSSQCFDAFVGGGGDQLPGRTLALTPSKRFVSGQLKLPSSSVTGTWQQMRFRIHCWHPSCPPARLHCDLANMRQRYGWRRNRANQFVECVSVLDRSSMTTAILVFGR